LHARFLGTRAGQARPFPAIGGRPRPLPSRGAHPRAHRGRHARGGSRDSITRAGRRPPA